MTHQYKKNNKKKTVGIPKIQRLLDILGERIDTSIYEEEEEEREEKMKNEKKKNEKKKNEKKNKEKKKRL